MIRKMDHNRELIHTDMATLVFYMNGSLDFNDAYCLSMQQRKIMAKVVKEYRESQSPKSGGRLI